MKHHRILTGALALALAFTGGLLIAEHRAPSAAVASSAPAGAPLSRAELAAVVRAELARAQPAPAACAAAPAAPPSGPATSTPGEADAAQEPAEVDGPAPTEADGPALAARIADARELVDDALARGEWTDADADALADRLVGLSGEQAVAILARRNDAVNRGALRVTTSGPLL